LYSISGNGVDGARALGKNILYLLYFSLANVVLTCNRVQFDSNSSNSSFIGLRWTCWDGVHSAQALASDASLRAARCRVLLRVVDGELVDGGLSCDKRLA